MTFLTTAALVQTLDLIGTFVFAISGAASGVKSRLDVFGVSVLAFVAGNAGGMARDVLIGAVPPAAISNWRYVAASLVAGSRRICGSRRGACSWAGGGRMDFRGLDMAGCTISSPRSIEGPSEQAHSTRHTACRP